MFPRYILLTDQTSLPDYLCFLRYWAIQFARIHTSSLIKIEKILNRHITKFYNSHDVNVIAVELQLIKRGQLLYISDIIFRKKQYQQL